MRPLRSLGSNQVDLGGMILPLSAMAMSCATVVGNMENAARYWPLSTRFSSSAVPRMPPTKSIRFEVRGSSMPSTGESRLSWSTLTSSDRTGSDVYGTNSAEMGVKVPVAEGGRFEARFGFPLNLGPGQYTLSAALHAGVQHLAGSYDWADQIGGFEVVSAPTCRFTGNVWLPTKLEVTEAEPARNEDLAALWETVLADAPSRIMLSDESARFLLSGVERARSVVGGQENAGDGVRTGGEFIAALRLAGARVTVELTNGSAKARTAGAFIASTCLGDAELAPGRHAVEFEVPAGWCGKVALLRVQCGKGLLVCHGISCE